MFKYILESNTLEKLVKSDLVLKRQEKEFVLICLTYVSYSHNTFSLENNLRKEKCKMVTYSLVLFGQ